MVADLDSYSLLCGKLIFTSRPKLLESIYERLDRALISTSTFRRNCAGIGAQVNQSIFYVSAMGVQVEKCLGFLSRLVS